MESYVRDELAAVVAYIQQGYDVNRAILLAGGRPESYSLFDKNQLYRDYCNK